MPAWALFLSSPSPGATAPLTPRRATSPSRFGRTLTIFTKSFPAFRVVHLSLLCRAGTLILYNVLFPLPEPSAPFLFTSSFYPGMVRQVSSLREPWFWNWDFLGVAAGSGQSLREVPTGHRGEGTVPRRFTLPGPAFVPLLCVG